MNLLSISDPESNLKESGTSNGSIGPGQAPPYVAIEIFEIGI